MPIARMTQPKLASARLGEYWQEQLGAVPAHDEDNRSLDPQIERIKSILRLGLVSLIGYELVQRTSQARPYKHLIDVITNQRIAVCHLLIKCSFGGLNGVESITADEAEFRNAWTRVIKVAELEDRKDLTTELEHVESLLEQFAREAMLGQSNQGAAALEEFASSARGCREVWSLITFVNEEEFDHHDCMAPLNE